MGSIRTSSGYEILVDDADLPVVLNFNWRVEVVGRITKRARVFTSIGGSKRRQKIYLSRLLLCEPVDQVDHVSGDTLDNRRSNLRVCTPRQNSQNQVVTARGTSRFKGVHLRKSRHGRVRLYHPWGATIRVDGKKLKIGSFRDEVDAARAYDRSARKHFGEFARLNFSA